METGRLVTPEAVVLQFETAGLGSRLLAVMIDLAILGVVLVAAATGLTAFAEVGALTSGVAVAVLFVVIFACLFGYFVGFETLWRGRTLGKAALGLRVVTREGAPVGFRHAAIRAALTMIDFWLTSGAGAVLTVLFTRQNQRLGDLAAGTLVLRERTGATPPAAVRFPAPPGWEGYVASLDVAAMTAAEYQAARSLLMRAATLPPAVRTNLAAELGTSLATRLRHGVPEGMGPELYLACVAAAYQQRAGGPLGAPEAAAPAWHPAREVWAPTPAGGAAPAPAGVADPAPSTPGPFAPPG